jgi:chemotaxis protein CheC
MESKEGKKFAVICNESSKNAGTALKQMINKDVSVNFPNMELKTISLNDFLEKNNLIGISDINGEVNGSIIMAYPEKNGLKLLAMMLMQPSLESMTDDAKSAFTELLNILGGAFLNTMSDMLNFTLAPEPPHFIGNVKNFEKELLKKNEKTQLFLIDNYLDIESEQIGGHFFLIFENESLNKIVKSLNN